MTYYSLVVRNVKNFKEYCKLSDTLKEFDLINYVFEDGAYYETAKEAVFQYCEEQEWRKHDGQMIIISEKYPHMVFELTCTCERTNWRVYYKDGQSEVCTGDIIFAAPERIEWEKVAVF